MIEANYGGENVRVTEAVVDRPGLSDRAVLPRVLTSHIPIDLRRRRTTQRLQVGRPARRTDTYYDSAAAKADTRTDPLDENVYDAGS